MFVVLYYTKRGRLYTMLRHCGYVCACVCMCVCVGVYVCVCVCEHYRRATLHTAINKALCAHKRATRQVKLRINDAQTTQNDTFGITWLVSLLRHMAHVTPNDAKCDAKCVGMTHLALHGSSWRDMSHVTQQ